MHPPAIPIFEHPEIEHLDFVDLKNFLREENDVETSVDVVEVWRVQIGQPSLDGFTHRHRQNLPHVALVDHLSVSLVSWVFSAFARTYYLLTANRTLLRKMLSLRCVFCKKTCFDRLLGPSHTSSTALHAT